MVFGINNEKMKVLWITNVLPNHVSDFINENSHASGGWLTASANELKHDIKLSIASAYGGSDLKVIDLEGIRYYLLPSKKVTVYEKSLESLWQEIKDDFNPDLVHIQGTEYALGLSYLKACGKTNTIITIQGLVSAISYYYLSAMSFLEIFSNITLRDILKRDTIFNQKKSFFNRGKIEKSYLKLVENVIGRTYWDYSKVISINSKIKYHHCNESLRESFYFGNWDIDLCEKYSIFVSQGSYPIKGLHQLLKAMPAIIQKFPNTRLYIGGWNRVYPKSVKERLVQDGYSKYLSSLIKKLKLENYVFFVGTLSEDEMKKRFLSSHIFVCPSSIENSSNSVGEAQLLGLPVVAAYVGGMSDIIEDKKDGFLYRYEEIEVLSMLIIDVFSNKFDLNEISKRSKTTANNRHNRLLNKTALLNIYNKILNL